MSDVNLQQKVQDLYDEGLSRYRIQKSLNMTKKQMDEVIDELNIHFITRQEIKERNQDMLTLRNKGYSLESIGHLYEVNGSPMTKEGVRLAIKNAVADGGELKVTRGKSIDKENKHSIRFKSRQLEAIKLFQDGIEEKDIAKQLNVCEKTVSSYLRDLPAYQKKHAVKNQPIKSTLSYEAIVNLKKEGVLPSEIARRAGISLPRVLQILQMHGNYKPNKKTVQRIRRVVEARNGDEAVKDIAKRESITEGQIYRYINLAKVLKDAGKL